MSNALAVPAVTAAITTLVQAAVDGLGINPRPIVAPAPLDGTGDNARVGVHLQRVTRNAGLSVADLPTRSAAGQLRQRPRVALDLHYLLTFRGNDEWESQALMARSAAALHAEPVVTAARLAQAEADHPEIAGHDLGHADEPVRVTSDIVSVDELTRIWALYPPGSFAVTLAVMAGPVLVDADGEPGVVLPVRRALVGARPFEGLRLDTVGGPDGAGAPVRAASPMPDLDLRGAGLGARPGETVEVLLDGAVVPHTTVDEGALVVAGPPIGPGGHIARVRRRGAPVDPALSPTAMVATSEAVAFLVVPSLGPVTPATGAGSEPGLRSGTVTAAVVPALSPSQRVRLLLDSRALTPPVALALAPDWPAGAPPFPNVAFDVVDAPAGQYRATLEVDGARSLPAVGPTGLYLLTLVTL